MYACYRHLTPRIATRFEDALSKWLAIFRQEVCVNINVTGPTSETVLFRSFSRECSADPRVSLGTESN
jgi:hypothetical protein